MINLINLILDKYGFKNLILRIGLAFLSSLWFAFLPIYLIIIYMFREGFFSYDFFVDGVFGLKVFLIVMLLFITVLSTHLWGFLLLWKKARHSKESGTKKKLRYACFAGALIWSISLHWIIYELAKSAGDGKVLVGISFLGFCLVLLFFVNFGKSWQSIALNWQSPLVVIFLSATIPAILASETAALVGYALKNFAVGGGVLAKIYTGNDYKKLAFCGPLLLLTPKNAYIRDGERQFKLVVISEAVSIAVKKNPDEKEMNECLVK